MISSSKPQRVPSPRAARIPSGRSGARTRTCLAPRVARYSSQRAARLVPKRTKFPSGADSARASTPGAVAGRIRRAFILVGPLGADDGGDGFEQNDQVCPQALAFNVEDIQFHLVREIDFRPSADLPETGDARGHVEAPAVGLAIEGDLAGNRGARADQ